MLNNYKKSNKVNKSSKKLLIVCTIICFVLIFTSFFSKSNNNYLSYCSNLIFYPMQKGISSISNRLISFTDSFKSKSLVLDENKKLKNKISELVSENNKLNANQNELIRLKKELKLNKYIKYNMVGAEIIARDSNRWFNIITIDKGSTQGIKQNMCVVSNGALVGIVTSVGPFSSTVRTIIDDQSAVSCVIEGKDNVLLLEGNINTIRNGYLYGRYLDPDVKVNVGDKIVTSTVSKHYLPDILVGYISEVNKNKDTLEVTAKITPVINFNSLREVMVITQLKDNGEKGEK